MKGVWDSVKGGAMKRDSVKRGFCERRFLRKWGSMKEVP